MQFVGHGKYLFVQPLAGLRIGPMRGCLRDYLGQVSYRHHFPFRVTVSEQ
jgi:hypothetical protein